MSGMWLNIDGEPVHVTLKCHPDDISAEELEALKEYVRAIRDLAGRQAATEITRAVDSLLHAYEQLALAQRHEGKYVPDAPYWGKVVEAREKFYRYLMADGLPISKRGE